MEGMQKLTEETGLVIVPGLTAHRVWRQPPCSPSAFEAMKSCNRFMREHKASASALTPALAPPPAARVAPVPGGESQSRGSPPHAGPRRDMPPGYGSDAAPQRHGGTPRSVARCRGAAYP